MLEEMSNDILLAAYEPTRIRPGSAWLIAQQRANHAARKLNELLLDWLAIVPQNSMSALRTIGPSNFLPDATSVAIPCGDCSPASPLDPLLRSRLADLHAARAAIGEAMNHD